MRRLSYLLPHQSILLEDFCIGNIICKTQCLLLVSIPSLYFISSYKLTNIVCNRPVDVSAFKAVGKVLAQRCLQSGINSVYCDIEANEGTKVKFKIFLSDEVIFMCVS